MKKQKEYYINIFLKKSKYNIVIKNAINYRMQIIYTEYKELNNIQIEKIQKDTYEKYMKEIIKLFDKKFNLNEIKELIDFFSSDIGKKLSSKELSKGFDEIMEKTMIEVDNLMHSKGEHNEAN